MDPAFSPENYRARLKASTEEYRSSPDMVRAAFELGTGLDLGTFIGTYEMGAYHVQSFSRGHVKFIEHNIYADHIDDASLQGIYTERFCRFIESARLLSV